MQLSPVALVRSLQCLGFYQGILSLDVLAFFLIFNIASNAVYVLILCPKFALGHFSLTTIFFKKKRNPGG